MAVLQYVTETLAYMVSGNMDAGCADYHLEAAISKVSHAAAAGRYTYTASGNMAACYYNVYSIKCIMESLLLLAVIVTAYNAGKSCSV